MRDSPSSISIGLKSFVFKQCSPPPPTPLEGRDRGESQSIMFHHRQRMKDLYRSTFHRQMLLQRNHSPAIPSGTEHSPTVNNLFQ